MTDPANPSDNGQNPPAVARQTAGHELPFVTPSTYLHLPTRPLASASNSPAATILTAAHGHSRTVPQPAQPDPAPAPEKPPMTPLDKDQVQGLVSKRAPFLDAQVPFRDTFIPRSYPSDLRLPLMAHWECKEVPNRKAPILRPHRLPVPRRRGLLLTLAARCHCATCIGLRGIAGERCGRRERGAKNPFVHLPRLNSSRSSCTALRQKKAPVFD